MGNLHEPKWGRMESCGRLLIGLLAMKRKLKEADCQSNATRFFDGKPGGAMMDAFL
jgi:hypothetical protein